MKKLSIVVPVYKVEDYLEKCVESLILGMGEENLIHSEILLIDDGSPDRCPQLCDKLANKYSIIKVIHKQNEGVSKARNTGIENAEGEYVTFCDSDDFVTENFKEIFSYINNFPDIDFFSVGLIKNNKIISKFKTQTLYPTNYDDLFKIVKNDVTISCCAKIVKREFVVNNNIYFPSGIKSEDLVWSYDMLFKSTKMMLIDLAYYTYVERETSVTHTTTLNGIESQLENYRRLKNLVQSLKLSDKQKKQLLSYLMQGFIYSIYTSKFLNQNEKQIAKTLFIKNKDLLYKPHGIKMFLFYLYLKIFYF